MIIQIVSVAEDCLSVDCLWAEKKTFQQGERADRAVQKALDEQTAANELLKKREEEMEKVRAALDLACNNVTVGQDFEQLRSSFFL